MPTFRDDLSLGIKVPLVQTADLRDQTVTTEKIADESVTTEKLADGSVTGDKLADGTLPSAKIADGAITTEKLADGSITDDKIAEGSISAQKLADDFQVTDRMIESGTLNQIQTLLGTWSDEESLFETNEEARKANEVTRQSQETARETQAASDHDTAVADHNAATTDHSTADADHTQAVADTEDYNTNIKSEVNELAQKVDVLEDNAVVTKDIANGVRNYWSGLINCRKGQTVDLTAFTSNSSYVYQLIEGESGDNYVITATGTTSLRCVVVLDESCVITRIVGYSSASNVSVTLGDGEKYICVNGKTSEAFVINHDITLKEDYLDSKATDEKRLDDVENELNNMQSLKQVASIAVGGSSVFSFVYKDVVYTLAGGNLYADGVKYDSLDVCAAVRQMDGVMYYAVMSYDSTSGDETIVVKSYDIAGMLVTEIGSITCARYNKNYPNVVSLHEYGSDMYMSVSSRYCNSGISTMIYTVTSAVTLVETLEKSHIWGWQSSDSSKYGYKTDGCSCSVLDADDNYLYIVFKFELETALIRYDGSTFEYVDIHNHAIANYQLAKVLGTFMIDDKRYIVADKGMSGYDNTSVVSDDKENPYFASITKWLADVNGSLGTITGLSVEHQDSMLVITVANSTATYVYMITDADFVYFVENGYNKMSDKSLSDLPFGYSTILTKTSTDDVVCRLIPKDPSDKNGGTESIAFPLGSGDKLKVVNCGAGQYHFEKVYEGDCPQQSHVVRNDYYSNTLGGAYFRALYLSSSPDASVVYGTFNMRYATIGDGAPSIQWFCRSFDGGRTWQDFKKPFSTVSVASENSRFNHFGHIIDNNQSSPYYGRIYILCGYCPSGDNTDNVNEYRIYIQHSDDCGNTWHGAWDNSDDDGECLDITDQILTDANKLLWKRFAGSIGEGFAIKGGACDGYLVRAYWVDMRGADSDYRPTLLYSADNGQTWQVGATGATGNEGVIIQDSENTLLASVRPNFSSTRLFYKIDLSQGIDSAWTQLSGVGYSTNLVTEGFTKVGNWYLMSKDTGTVGTRSKHAVFKSKDLKKWYKVVTLTKAYSKDSGYQGYSSLYYNENGVLLFGVENKDNTLWSLDCFNLNYLVPYLKADGASGAVDDVTVDGSSVVTDGVAVIDLSGKADASEVDELSQLVSEKQDAPESAGTEGQVLGLNSELKPVWKDAGGGDTDEIEEVSATALVETREYIDSLLNGITSKGKVIMSKDVVDTLTSLSSLRPLSAFQGRLLNENTLDNEQVTAAAICALSGMLKPAAIAPEYSASKVYTVGQYVINDGYLYKCSTAIEKPEFFDSDKWTLTSVMEVISSL